MAPYIRGHIEGVFICNHSKYCKILRLGIGILTLITLCGRQFHTTTVDKHILNACLFHDTLLPNSQSASGISNLTSPLSTIAPKTNTSETNGPICFGGKFTTATT